VISVCTVAVPLQVAEPLAKVAVVGATVAPKPGEVMVSWVPLAIVFWLVKGTVAVALVTPLKLESVQVCPFAPVMVPPEV
jgi:hypothetical protein